MSAPESPPPRELHGDALLEALSGAGLEMLKARTFDGVLAAALKGLKDIGISLVVVQWRAEGLVLRQHNLDLNPSMLAALGPEPWVVGSHEVTSDKLPLRSAEAAGRPVYIEDMEGRLSPHYQQVMPDRRDALVEGLRSVGFGKAVVAPVKVREAWWGGLLLTWPGMRREDSFAIGLFALQFGSALEAADTIERLKARNTELEVVYALAVAGPTQSVEALAATLVEALGRATASDVGSVYRFDAERREYVRVGDTWGDETTDRGLFERLPLASWFEGLGSAIAFATSKLPEHGPQVQALGFQHVAIAPLNMEGRPVGMLSVARRRDESYGAAELQVAERLGAQAAAFLERARLYDEASRRVRQLSLLFDLAHTGATTRQVQPLVDRLLGRMVETFPADVATVHFLTRGEFSLAGWKWREGLPRDPPTPATMPLDDRSVIGAAALAKKLVSKGAADFPPFTAENARRHGFNRLMSAPMLAGGNVMGCVSAARQGDDFSQEEKALLESVASQMAVLLEQARLYDDLRTSYVELARAQAEVVRHERLAALGEVAAVMAHEVRNPLGVIFNSLTSLKKLLTPTGDVELLLRIVGEEADRLNRIVADLLDFARPYAPERSPVALESLVAGAVQAASASVATQGIRIVTQFPEVMPEVPLDGHLVRQALVNLVVNAVQAMPRGGTVTVRASLEQDGSRGWARIAVTDQGPGIPPQAAERIFQPFFTTKATGTGLGLAVVKRIAEAQSGEVLVNTGPAGTTFTLRLPLQ
jgi:signal transduction histidine kinase